MVSYIPSGVRQWIEIMGILTEKDALGDEEVLVYTMTLINKVTGYSSYIGYLNANKLNLIETV